MTLGIDFGASATDAVLLKGKRIAQSASSGKPLRSAAAINSFLEENGFGSSRVCSVAATGGKSASFSGRVLGLNPVKINEVSAIGKGAAWLSHSRKCLAVSLGTGTCIVLYDRGESSHVTGTGLGGGTITGLSKLLLGETRIEKLKSLALKGSRWKVDLSVREVVGNSIASLSPNATASNFAKGKGSKADMAAAVQGMVAEAVAVLAVSAARQCKCKKIVFTGKTTEFPFVKKRLRAAASLLGAKFAFPLNRGFATALGAALEAGSRQGAGENNYFKYNHTLNTGGVPA